MPNQPDEYAGYSPAATPADTEGVNPPVGTAPGSPGTVTQAQQAGNQDTTGTSVAGIGPALPGGSVTDVMPWAGAGQAGSGVGQAPQHDYAVRPVQPGVYGFQAGAPDTEEVYGGAKPNAPVTSASPFPWLPTSTMLTQTLDTQVGGGSALTSGLGTPPAYRAPSAGVAGSVKDTSLTDLMGNMVTAMPLTDSSYGAVNIDTSYIGAPAAPASLSRQTDTFTATAAATSYYASQAGIVPSSLVVTDVTNSNLVLIPGSDYTVTTAGNGPKTSLYIVLTHVLAHWTAGDTVTLAYSYGSPQYYDSNLPPATSQTTTDTFAISQLPVQLSAWNVTTAASALAVFDVTRNAALVYNTDYSVTLVTGPYTPGSTYAETPPTTYAIKWLPTAPTARLGDTVTVTYAYNTSVPAAPGMGAGTSQTDTVVITATAQALSRTGITTPPGSVRVVNNQAGANLGKVLVLNVDYTLAVTGSGSTLSYTIARLSTSPSSALNDSLLVTYSYGNASYFTSGPVVPVDKGVFVPWSPPSGSTQVDYYLIQSSDLGTMYVPMSGQPMFYGQMSPSGGPSYGMPTYQSDTFTGTFSHTTPVTLSKTGIITAPGQLIVRDLSSTQKDPLQPTGTLLIYGYDYTVTQTGTGLYASYQVQRVASSVNSADGDTITVAYQYDTMGTVPLTWVNDAITAAGGVASLTNKDVAVAPSGLIVYDTTISKALAYGLDYTVASAGAGPAETMTITLITTGPAGAGLTDALHVYYGYGIVLGAVYRQGLVPNQVPIYTPAGAIRTPQTGGYQLAVAAGNRAGLGPYSNWSDYAVPLNYMAPQPGFEGTTTAGTGSLDPRNSINPIYKPDGTIKAGTGLGP
jgi:hypothetical protein